MPSPMAEPRLHYAKRSVFKNLRRASDRALHRSLPMPFKSQAQRRYLHAQHPKIAKRWEKEYPVKGPLPERRNKRK